MSDLMTFVPALRTPYSARCSPGQFNGFRVPADAAPGRPRSRSSARVDKGAVRVAFSDSSSVWPRFCALSTSTGTSTSRLLVGALELPSLALLILDDHSSRTEYMPPPSIQYEMSRDIRARALERLASLAAVSPNTTTERSDLEKLCKACHSGGRGREFNHKSIGSLGRVPMSIREFEVLIALCKTAPNIESAQSAQRLCYRLIPYIFEAHSQIFVSSPYFRKIDPSPTESLSFHVTAALLALGSRHSGLREAIADGIWRFTNECSKATESLLNPLTNDFENPQLEDAIRTATIAVALVGFLDAASAQADFWKAGGCLVLIQKIRQLLSEPFLVAVESSLSVIRNSQSSGRDVKEWKRLMRQYVAADRPMGAMLLQRSFMWLVLSSSSLMVADPELLRNTHILDLLMSKGGKLDFGPDQDVHADFRSIETYAGLAVEQMNHIEAGADFVEMGVLPQQKLASAVKSSALITYMNCALLNDEAADPDVLMAWLQETLEDPHKMVDETLATTVLQCLALICHISPSYSSTVSRLLPRFLVQTVPQGITVAVASKSLAFVLKLLSKDAVISTLYTLGNVLSPGSGESAVTAAQPNGSSSDLAPASIYINRQSTGSAISLTMDGEEECAIMYGNVVQAICGIATAFDDEKITALAQSMLLQKLSKVNASVDTQVIAGAATLALSGGQLEFRSLLKVLSRICHNGVVESKDFILGSVRRARTHISARLRRDSPLFDIYWEHLLDSIISLGDAHSHSHAKDSDVQLAAREIGELLHPLAVFMSSNDLACEPITNDDSYALLRDAWFNIVVHGFMVSTDLGKKYLNELRMIAVHSPPLVASQRSEQVESDIELNTVLRRGSGHERELVQKRLLSDLVPSKAGDIRSLSYRKVIFLQAAYMVESLRADAGDCTKALTYFLEPSMRKGEVSSTMEGISWSVVDKYLRKTLSGANPSFSSQYVANQLASIFRGCCHRIERVQQAAFACADQIISQVPSALCHKSSLFALLELLSLLWAACLEAETDVYTPRSTFTSELGRVKLELSDDYDFRRRTLEVLNRKAKVWVNTAINLAPLDVKGLLQTYLSEFHDEGAYGHISLGRSFALELGSIIPSTDNRLQSLDRIGDCNINTASDLIAQYTTRQEYRYGEIMPDHGNELMSFMSVNRRASFVQATENEGASAAAALAHIEAKILSKKTTSLDEVRSILRRAAAMLCRGGQDESAVARYLVSIPFALFTKHSIKLGVSLWLGVMNENPKLEAKLLNAIAQQWEFTISRKVGLFHPALAHPDPFFMKMDFAPSELEGLAKRRQIVHDILSPHTRLLQFFSSHFNATRLGSPDVQRVFLRMLDLTMDAVKKGPSHPMARELRFQIGLFALHTLRRSTTIGPGAQYRLKDKILSAGLSWFRNSPRWSFGSNVIQLRTEYRLISDLISALKLVSSIGAHATESSQSLQSKEQLLMVLLESEQTRLTVWTTPRGAQTHYSVLHHSPKAISEGTLVPLVQTAWRQDPSLAIELATRFNAPRVHRDIRNLILSAPDRAVGEPEALPLILGGGGLSGDLTTSELKYLLYWEPLNPLTAITLFLPVYRDNPLLIQYAMRALESHSVDVTFFYVPQIVQTLRYDTLGYVERYILETAQFSQHFAHQIIWNMKANSYKDDDAQIPDAIKPTLDSVMAKMVDSFAAEDKEFYEREFAFFDEVTSISGKLKPYIKKSKPEKKQKIEEELRKIKVDVGVYLPINADGIVIGIDRQSGKPLQSHAKAPYMATFRIKRSKGGLEELENELLDGGQAAEEGAEPDNTVEVWQSCIFKVGDDCRQDVLALQMIAAFRGIFHSVGLEVYVFPYRVTATAPGCGVIEVLPNSISRDMLGREAVNGLYDYFVSKYGNEDSLRFQQARMNFIKSMAAYSVISFLLQFKDRHNGNIMIDDAGHILHIDFGFCFDIAPGGIKFERAPFKLTSEMLAVMGGSTDHQSFKWFEDLCIKAFLASRQYCEKLSQIVQLMMDSGLPCFKPESVQHFKDRFVLERTEREAADFMKDLIKKSYSSYSTGIYDQFQLLTNGIPF